MKKAILLMMLAIPLFGMAQTYEFSVRQGNYENLENSTSLNNGQVWDDPNYQIPLGFNFRFFDRLTDNMTLDGEEFGFGGTLLTAIDPIIVQLLIVNEADLIDRGFLDDNSLSNISHLIEGDEGERIFKLEWNNAGFYSELFDDEVSEDFTNFQLWLYEEDDAIEIHFGPNSIQYPELSYDGLSGTIVGLVDSFNLDAVDVFFTEAYFLEGEPLNPVYREVFSSDLEENPITLNGDIPDGTIYRFSRRTSSTLEIEGLALTISPNPVIDRMKIEWPDNGGAKAEVELFNASGQLLQRWEQVENGSALDLGRFTKGMYFIRLPEVSSGSYLIYKD
ncbi:MAG TPA: T9SS type A sorting domain-containing protein [Saprospiraceae bacterium]|nr:T9SS type A sorting domain-containing protein [Saprospiraceae bacterium]